MKKEKEKKVDYRQPDDLAREIVKNVIKSKEN